MKNKYRLIIVAAATISFLLSVSAFVFDQSWLTKGWLKLQIVPNLTKIFASFESLSIASFSTLEAAVNNLTLILAQDVGVAVNILLVMLLLAFCCGRFYCSVLCPLGILQDIIDFFSSHIRAKENRQARGSSKVVFKTPLNLKKTRYCILAVAFITLLGGWVVVWKALDPYSNFGKIVLNGANWARLLDTGISWTGLFFLLALIVLVVWKRRIFCTAICPAGTLLGLCSKNGMLKLGISEKCSACGRCAKVCPAKCINLSSKAIDNERCLRCLKCLGMCPNLKFLGIFKKQFNPKIEARFIASRRSFIWGGMLTLTGIVLGRLFNPEKQMQACYKAAKSVPCLTPTKIEKAAYFIAPPGAGSPERFLAKCTACQLCVAHCVGQVLKPAGCGTKNKFSGDNSSIHLDFKNGHCNYNCNRCGAVCSTGAIRQLDLAQKKRWRIGMANITYDLCVTITDGTECGACAEQCPTGALQMIAGTNGARMPQLNAELCIGCGSCEEACPVLPERAIIVKPISIQVLADDPQEFFKKQRSGSEERNKSKEWLL
ncbi:MAG: 4Fe-4S binding protein [Deltaproteobacteria bacterium]|jgi:polyferredoxin|nr:4Fe-4S binding protein [Deltaproteobacteria bacterium]